MYKPDSTSHPTKLGTLLGAGTGAVIAAPAILAGIMSGGAGHGTYAVTRVLFPFSMLLTRLEGSIGAVAIGVGMLQFPLYGALIGRSSALKTYWAVFFAAAAHLVAAFACFSELLPSF